MKNFDGWINTLKNFKIYPNYNLIIIFSHYVICSEQIRNARAGAIMRKMAFWMAYPSINMINFEILETLRVSPKGIYVFTIQPSKPNFSSVCPFNVCQRTKTEHKSTDVLPDRNVPVGLLTIVSNVFQKSLYDKHDENVAYHLPWCLRCCSRQNEYLEGSFLHLKGKKVKSLK